MFILFQNLSELEPHELKAREEYLKQKRDALMALKKDSKIRLAPQNTDQKEESSPSKEVKNVTWLALTGLVYEICFHLKYGL